MKPIILLLLCFDSIFLLGQRIPFEVKNINSSSEFENAINQICTNYGVDFDEELKNELKEISYNDLINNFKKDQTFEKLSGTSKQTTTFTLLSKDYGILQSYISLSLENETHTYSYNHDLKKVDFVCSEKESNTFLSFANSMEDRGLLGLILIVTSFPNGEAGIEVIKGLSIMQMQYLQYLERYAKNIKK